MLLQKLFLKQPIIQQLSPIVKISYHSNLYDLTLKSQFWFSTKQDQEKYQNTQNQQQQDDYFQEEEAEEVEQGNKNRKKFDHREGEQQHANKQDRKDKQLGKNEGTWKNTNNFLSKNNWKAKESNNWKAKESNNWKAKESNNWKAKDSTEQMSSQNQYTQNLSTKDEGSNRGQLFGGKRVGGKRDKGDGEEKPQQNQENNLIPEIWSLAQFFLKYRVQKKDYIIIHYVEICKQLSKYLNKNTKSQFEQLSSQLQLLVKDIIELDFERIEFQDYIHFFKISRVIRNNESFDQRLTHKYVLKLTAILHRFTSEADRPLSTKQLISFYGELAPINHAKCVTICGKIRAKFLIELKETKKLDLPHSQITFLIEVLAKRNDLHEVERSLAVILLVEINNQLQTFPEKYFLRLAVEINKARFDVSLSAHRILQIIKKIFNKLFVLVQQKGYDKLIRNSILKHDRSGNSYFDQAYKILYDQLIVRIKQEQGKTANYYNLLYGIVQIMSRLRKQWVTEQHRQLFKEMALYILDLNQPNTNHGVHKYMVSLLNHGFFQKENEEILNSIVFHQNSIVSWINVYHYSLIGLKFSEKILEEQLKIPTTIDTFFIMAAVSLEIQHQYYPHNSNIQQKYQSIKQFLQTEDIGPNQIKDFNKIAMKEPELLSRFHSIYRNSYFLKVKRLFFDTEISNKGQNSNLKAVQNTDINKSEDTTADIHKSQNTNADIHKSQDTNADINKSQNTNADVIRSQNTNADVSRNQKTNADQNPSQEKQQKKQHRKHSDYMKYIQWRNQDEDKSRLLTFLTSVVSLTNLEDYKIMKELQKITFSQLHSVVVRELRNNNLSLRKTYVKTSLLYLIKLKYQEVSKRNSNKYERFVDRFYQSTFDLISLYYPSISEENDESVLEVFWPLLEVMVRNYKNMQEDAMGRSRVTSLFMKCLHSNEHKYMTCIGFKNFLIELIKELPTFFIDKKRNMNLITCIIHKSLQNNLLMRYNYDENQIPRMWFYRMDNKLLDILQDRISIQPKSLEYTITHENLIIYLRMNKLHENLRQNQTNVLNLIKTCTEKDLESYLISFSLERSKLSKVPEKIYLRLINKLLELTSLSNIDMIGILANIKSFERSQTQKIISKTLQHYQQYMANYPIVDHIEMIQFCEEFGIKDQQYVSAIIQEKILHKGFRIAVPELIATLSRSNYQLPHEIFAHLDIYIDSNASKVVEIVLLNLKSFPNADDFLRKCFIQLKSNKSQRNKLSPIEWLYLEKIMGEKLPVRFIDQEEQKNIYLHQFNPTITHLFKIIENVTSIQTIEQRLLQDNVVYAFQDISIAILNFDPLENQTYLLEKLLEKSKDSKDSLIDSKVMLINIENEKTLENFTEEIYQQFYNEKSGKVYISSEENQQILEKIRAKDGSL